MDEKAKPTDAAAPTPAVSDEVQQDAVEASGQLQEAQAGARAAAEDQPDAEDDDRDDER